MLWDGKFLQIDGDLAFRSIPQQIQVKVENIFLFLLMAGEDPSIIKYKFRDKNFQLAVSSMKVEQGSIAISLRKPCNARTTSGNCVLEGGEG